MRNHCIASRSVATASSRYIPVGTYLPSQSTLVADGVDCVSASCRPTGVETCELCILHPSRKEKTFYYCLLSRCICSKLHQGGKRWRLAARRVVPIRSSLGNLAATVLRHLCKLVPERTRTAARARLHTRSGHPKPTSRLASTLDSALASIL